MSEDMPKYTPQSTQSFLLSDAAMQAASYSTYKNFQPQISVSSHELQAWKQRIIDFQNHLQIAPVAQQGNLFQVMQLADEANNEISRETNHEVVRTLDPFSLRRQNTEFWRWQFDDVGVAALYFVIDYAAGAESNQLLLYIGETVKCNQRWKDEHDCKRYLLNYRQAHYEHGLNSELGIAFWPHAAAERQPRQALESGLIYRWRSPFNKENWRFWNTPFVSSK